MSSCIMNGIIHEFIQGCNLSQGFGQRWLHYSRSEGDKDEVHLQDMERQG